MSVLLRCRPTTWGLGAETTLRPPPCGPKVRTGTQWQGATGLLPRVESLPRLCGLQQMAVGPANASGVKATKCGRHPTGVPTARVPWLMLARPPVCLQVAVSLQWSPGTPGRLPNQPLPVLGGDWPSGYTCGAAATLALPRLHLRLGGCPPSPITGVGQNLTQYKGATRRQHTECRFNI